MTSLAGRLVLPTDVRIVAVRSLPAELRSRLRGDRGRFAIGRLDSRVPSRLVDRDVVPLIRQFRTPKRIVEGVVAYSLPRKLDPERTLIEAYPLFEDLVAHGLLAAPGSAHSTGSAREYAPGERVGDYTVLHSVAVLRDTQVVKATGPGRTVAAIKIARLRDEQIAGMLAHEARILERLDGRIAPGLLATGVEIGLSFLAIEWIEGFSPTFAAEEYRARGASGNSDLLRLCESIIDAYQTLHGRGVIHGDVHAGNVIVEPRGRIRLVDYGWASVGEQELPHGRAGAMEYLEPECAREILHRRPPPPASESSDQYGVAVLLYRLLTGENYLRFSLHHDRAVKQVAEAAPLAFAAHGAVPRPAIERTLLQALEKEPARRFPTMARFARAFRSTWREGPSRRTTRSSQSRFLGLTLRRLGVAEPMFKEVAGTAPVSLFWGSAGTALGVYRLACMRDDPQLLAQAEVWASHAEMAGRRETAFASEALELSRAVVGPTSVYHTRVGIEYLQAVLAAGTVQPGELRRRIARVIRAAKPPTRASDLLTGRAGSLLLASWLVELARDVPAARGKILAFGSALEREILRRISGLGSVGRSRQLANLGIAHGWAGILFAVLRWRETTDRPVPELVQSRLAQLAAEGRPHGRSIRWPWRDAPRSGGTLLSYMPGWCNGSAGMVHLWTLASRLLHEPRYGALAERAALDAWESHSPEWHLCCGTAGQAYALLEVYRHSGDRKWADRAKTLAERAATLAWEGSRAAPGPHTHSLFRGDLGLALLIADLDRPEEAAFPLFGSGR
jgi:serine/threonine-protein kinase